ncbi:hypothetical protein SOASR029_29890 [Budvicia aquatica]|nr:hypothetical protein SOASR029_29890 [Budvicia aquatica]
MTLTLNPIFKFNHKIILFGMNKFKLCTKTAFLKGYKITINNKFRKPVNSTRCNCSNNYL